MASQDRNHAQADQQQDSGADDLVKLSIDVPLSLRKELRKFATDAERDMKEVAAEAISRYLDAHAPALA